MARSGTDLKMAKLIGIKSQGYRDPDTTPSVTPPSTHIDTALTPTLPDYIPASPDYSPTSDTKFDLSEDPSSDHIPPLPAISPFLLSTNDYSNSDTPDTPTSPTHGTPFTKMNLSTQTTPVASSALHHDSLRDSPLSSSSETSSDPSSDDLPDTSSDHSLPAPSSGMRPSHHLCSLVPSIPRSSATITHISSHDYSSRIRSPESSMDLERLTYANALKARGFDARVVVEAVDREEIKTGAGGLVEVRVDRVTHPVIADDIPELAQEERAIESIQRDQGHMIVATGHQSADMMERIRDLERDNMRLKDMMDVAIRELPGLSVGSYVF
nr:hypothetical protein [Tanacetum cinerariifolium]